MRGVLILLVLNVSGYFVYGQLTMSEFLLSANEAVEVKSTDAQLTYLQGKPYRLSPLQKMEFRTQNRELNPDYQEFALRFAPANPWEMKSNNQYFAEYQNYLAASKKLALKEALMVRYAVLAEYLYYDEVRVLMNEHVQLIDKQIAILQRQTASSFFDADEYVKLRVQYLDKLVDSENASLEIMDQQSLINKLHPASTGRKLSYDPTSLISVEAIEAVVDSLKKREVSSTMIAYRQHKLNVDNKRYNLEKNNINMGFLQAEYDNRRAVQERTPYNIGLGITIPIVNPNKGDMARQKLNAIESEYELKEAELGERQNREMSFVNLKEAITYYKELQKKIVTLKDNSLAEDLSLIKGGDPLFRIKYETSMNNLKVVEAKLRRKVFNYYIDYLFAGDYLQQEPLVNYLKNNLESMNVN
jgi:hypothetical protein